jgi:hypothetical protein
MENLHAALDGSQGQTSSTPQDLAMADLVGALVAGYQRRQRIFHVCTTRPPKRGAIA